MTQAQYIPEPGGPARVLPDNAAVVRLIAGDSLLAGAPSHSTPLSELGEVAVRANGAATSTVLYDTTAYFWNKWFRDNGSSGWSGEYRNVYASEAANAWEVLHDRLGRNNGPAASGQYAALASAPDMNISWFIQSAKGALPEYRTASGAALPIHYVIHGTSSSLCGPYSTTQTVSWSPTHGAGLFELFHAHYVAPAINALRAAGKTVFIESMFFSPGGGDTSAAAGTPGAANIGKSLETFAQASALRVGGRVPTVFIRPYQTNDLTTFPDWAAGQTSFDARFDEFGDAFSDYIRMEGVPKDETWPGIHPTTDGLLMMAHRYAAAVARMVSRGARLVRVAKDLA